MKKVYVSESVGPKSRGRSRWRLKEYMCERGAIRGKELDQARRECFDILRDILRGWQVRSL